jgi:hypothetical protein
MTVPSSTSSSDARLWRQTWAITLALAFVLLGSWEIYWRLQGFTPSVTNDENLWALARGRVAKQPDGVLLVGSSRVQIGIDPDAFTRATGWPRPIQLAIAMGPSTPVLRELAEGPDVSQLVVCGIHPLIFFDAIRQLDGITERYIHRFDSFTPANAVEARLRTLTQRSLVASQPALFPHRILATLRGGRRPQPSPTRFDIERFGRSDARLMTGLAQKLKIETIQWRNWRGRPRSIEGVEMVAVLVSRFVNEIRAGGGDVVFVRMPSSGRTLAREHKLFPRENFWDLFATGVDAVAIHFEDYPELRGFDAPDGSHIDQSDTAAFSAALGTILVREVARRNGV